MSERCVPGRRERRVCLVGSEPLDNSPARDAFDLQIKSVYERAVQHWRVDILQPAIADASPRATLELKTSGRIGHILPSGSPPQIPWRSPL